MIMPANTPSKLPGDYTWNGKDAYKYLSEQTKFNKELTYIHQQALVSLRQNGYTVDVIIVEDR